MNARRNRQLSGVIGAFLLVIAAGALALLGGGALEEPLLVVQVTLLGLAGVCDIVAATDTALTERLAWYQWSGLGNILLGVSLPLGVVDSGGLDIFLIVVALGGFSLAAMGLDMLAFHGKYTRGERLDHDG
jgi:hypothetical protein